MKILKAVIPAAGYGTRFLPWTKAVPKEMLPLINKPAIQYIIQEIADSKINNAIIITAPYKYAIEKHFDECLELETFLEEKNKLNLLDDLKKLSNSVGLSYVFQEKALGLGHAISLTRDLISEEFFGVLLPDDIMVGKIPALQQLMNISLEKNASVIGIQEVPLENVSAYGVIAIKEQLNSDLFEIKNVVEKPAEKDAPSNLAIIGRYVLSSKIFKEFDKVSPSAGGEIQLTDAIERLLKNGERVYAYKMQGNRYDVGTPTGWLQANIDLSRGI